MRARATVEQPSRSAPRVTYLISQAWFAMRDRIDEALNPHGLTSMQFTLLSVLAVRKNLSSAQLSRRFYITPQAMGQVLNNLEEAGWITRAEDPANRRVLQVNLTKEGQELVKACDAEVRKIEKQVFDALDPDTLACMRAGLEAVVVRMREEA